MVLIKHIKIITDNKLLFENQENDQCELLVTLILYKRMPNLFMKNSLKCLNKDKCSNSTKVLVKPFGRIY